MADLRDLLPLALHATLIHCNIFINCICVMCTLWFFFIYSFEIAPKHSVSVSQHCSGTICIFRFSQNGHTIIRKLKSNGNICCCFFQEEVIWVSMMISCTLLNEQTACYMDVMFDVCMCQLWMTSSLCVDDVIKCRYDRRFMGK